MGKRPDANQAALDDITIVEVGLNEAGQYAGRLLASLGARVIKVEPLLGETERLLAPFVRDAKGRRRSVPYEYLNAGKESLALDIEDPFALEAIVKILADGGILMCSPEFRKKIPPQLQAIVVVASVNGVDNETTANNSALTRFLSGPSGAILPAPRPLSPGALAPDCIAGAGIAVTVMGMLAMREHDQRLADTVQPVADHATKAHAVNLEKMFIGRVALDNAPLNRITHQFPFGGAVKCRDGFVSMLINEEHQWRGLCEVIGKPGWAVDERFKGGAGRKRMREEIVEALDSYCSSRSMDEVLNAARERGVPIGGVRTIDAVMQDEYKRSRGFIVDVTTEYGSAALLQLPFGEDPIWRGTVPGIAPLLGQHSEAILHGLGFTDAEIAELEALQLTRCGDEP
jgi:crotonobetainyl-CoA:carnitine CoA-transferase CaiB-like acyl-CoA transferase